jgi:hypothetical protein
LTAINTRRAKRLTLFLAAWKWVSHTVALLAEEKERGRMFDSPFEYCLVCRSYVLLDQTQRPCRREDSCTAVSKCPLRRFFTGMEFREDQEA